MYYAVSAPIHHAHAYRVFPTRAIPKSVRQMPGSYTIYIYRSGVEQIGFLDERARRTNGVRTQHVSGNFLSEPQTRSSTVDPLDQDTLLHDPRTPQPARMWATADFVPAHLQSAIPFWRDVILPATTEAGRDTLLGWIRGVSVYEFVDRRAQGTFQGRHYSGPDLTSVNLPNHVPAEHCSWVTTEVEQLVGTGCIARWTDVADTSL